MKAHALNSDATKKLFAQLAAFLNPIAKAAGLEPREFSITTFTSMQLAGVLVGTEKWKDLDAAAQQRHLLAVLALQVAPLADLKAALRAAAGNFDDFFWDFVFEFGAKVPLETMVAVGAQLEEELPAVAAAQVEIATPPSLEGGSEGDKPPGN